MHKNIFFYILLLNISLFAKEYSFEFSTGIVHNMKENMIIKQDNEEDIVLNDVDLETHPFRFPMYYGMRLARWSDKSNAWEVEHLHQKLYIDNPEKLNPNIQQWENSDGFNFFFLNRLWKNKKNIVYRLGLGPVVVHPEITVRNKSNYKQGNQILTYGDGYHIAGAVIQGSIQKLFNLNKKWYLNLEGRLTYSRADVPIAQGSVFVQNRAAHFNFGIGYRFDIDL